jgi:hypothetical protein
MCTNTAKSEVAGAENIIIPSSSDLITGLGSPARALLLSIGREKLLDAWGRGL